MSIDCPVGATPVDDAHRVAALEALALLGERPDAEFDALVTLAGQTIACRTAMLTLIDDEHMWIRSASSPVPPRLPRALGFCDHTIRGDAMLIVEDLSKDARFAANPLVTDDPRVRFYAGVPIRVIDEGGVARALGALCVIDLEPRTLSAEDAATLERIAMLAEALIAARAAAARATRIAALSQRQSNALAEQDRVFRQAERIAMVGSWRLDIASWRVDWSEGVFHIHDLPVGSQPPPVEDALAFYPLAERARVAEAMDRTMKTGEPFDLESDFVTAKGRLIRVRAMGELDRIDGRAAAMVGVFQDITERHALETSLRRSADTDWLTGLSNRAAFDRRLDEALGAARRGEAPLVLALVDLDGFKLVNDTLGHQAGDDVLRAIGRKLRADWLAGSFAARIGGDEFALIVDDPALAGHPDRLQQQLQESLHATITTGGVRMTCAGTVGLAALPRDCRSVRDFVHRVDTILYAAKRNRVGDRRRPARQVA